MTRKKIIRGLLLVAGVIILGVSFYLNSLLPIITGYAAKNLCSAVFISSRSQEEVEKLDLNFSLVRYTRNFVDFADKSVTSHFLWGRSKAIFREGFGATLVRAIPESAIRKIKYPPGTQPGYLQDTIQWPLGDIIPDTETGIDINSLRNISNRLITGNEYNGIAFAFMVLYKGIPVTEAYRPHFDQHTRFLSWSMAKSFTNAMVGILVRQGKLNINLPVELDEWKNDGRRKITLNDLLQMQSGLKWNEDYGNRSDVTLMLHCSGNMGKFAIERPYAFDAGTHWYYSSGTTNIVSYLIRKQFDNDSLYYTFVNSELFNKTGMPDALFEVDPTGTRVGSSYIYATARDYARFALLFRDDGVLKGERILPEGWVKYCRTAASGSSGTYGASFWLNLNKRLPSVPEDMFACEGHDGQRIFIMPAQDLIVIVLGYSPKSQGGMDFDRLLKDILNTLPHND